MKKFGEEMDANEMRESIEKLMLLVDLICKRVQKLEVEVSIMRSIAHHHAPATG